MVAKVYFNDFDGSQLSAPFDIDHIWKAHVRDIRKYLDFCLRYAGQLIEHDLLKSLDPTTQQVARIENTRKALIQLFRFHVTENVDFRPPRLLADQLDQARHFRNFMNMFLDGGLP
jgi:hypothetical protein